MSLGYSPLSRDVTEHSALLMAHLAHADYPSDALLNELQRRMLESPDCSPTGATNRTVAQFTQRGTLLFQQFQQSMNVLKDTIGGMLDPIVRRVTKHFESLAITLTAFTSAHPMITKFAVMFAALAATIVIVAGGIK